MKKLLLTIGICLYTVGMAVGQTTLFFQDFEGGSDDWNFTLDPATFNVSGDIWAVVSSLGSITPTSGSNFFGVQDLESTSGTGSGEFGSITFDYVDVSGESNVEISFDYDIDGFDTNDDVWYVVYENTTQADSIQLIDGVSNFSSNGTVNYSVSATDSVRLIVYVRQNGGSDQGGFDNFKVTSSALKAEPTNHPTAFTATADGFSEIDLTWTDATGAVTPDAYLVKVSSTSLVAITDPSDGTSESDDTDVSDGSGVLNINQGTQSASFSGLSSGTQYFFKIYSYTNSGASIDYKTDGTIQSDDATTDSFDSDLVISQYVDTDSGTEPKGIEVWNVSGGTIDFSTTNLVVRRYSNGASSPTTEATVSSGTLADGDVLVIGGSVLSTYMSNNLPSVTFVNDGFSFNGDDALDITLDGTVQDVFGTIGSDPGSAWSGNGVSTADANIALNFGITEGTSTGFTDPSTRFSTINDPANDTDDLRGFGLAPGDVLITGDAGWRMLSFPVENGSADDISDDTAIQGVAGGDNTGETSNFITYDNSGAFETPTNVSTSIGNGYGFITYFFDNTDAGSSELPIVLDIAGTEPSSDVTVTTNSSVTSSGSYYTMVGNPFASNYDLNDITVTGGTISNNVTFWNNGSSSYSVQDRTTPYLVEPWQGFWVESTDGATSITIPTSGKSTSAATGTFFGKENADRGDLNFTLASENTYDEAIRLSVRPNATLGYDVDDASKFTPLTDTFATMAFIGELNGEEKLQSVFSIPSALDEEVIIPLDVEVYNTSGEFTFAWTNMETMPEGWTYELIDNETGNTVSLIEEASYAFEVDAPASKENRTVLNVATTMESSDESPRFGLRVTPSTSVSNEPEDKPFAFGLEQNYPNPFNPSTTIKYSVGETGPVSITVYNVMGQKVAELINATRGAGEYQVTWNADAQASGIYYYRLVAPGQVITRQMTLIK